MADISKITLPSGTTYNLKDQGARDLIDQMSGYTKFLGVTTTALTDGATTNPIKINSVDVTAEEGNIATYGSAEFIFNGTAWQAFGDLSGLGSLAYKNSASATYTPAGTVSQPTFTGTQGSVSVSGTVADSVTLAAETSSGTGKADVTPAGTVSAPTISVKTAGSTTTVKNPTAKTVVTDMSVSAPAAATATGELVYCSVSDETLSLKKFIESTGDSITTSNVTVKNGDAAYEATAPSFTGTAKYVKATVGTANKTMTGSFTPSGTVSQPTFSGTQTTITSS